MKRATLGTIFRYRGVLCEVLKINEGHRSLIFKPVGADPCPTCGYDHRTELIETSPLFQEDAEPVETVQESGGS